MRRVPARILLAAAAAACVSAAAANRDAVEISALRHPVDKSYRRMVDGMALFEARHALAPLASLRYRLLPRKEGVDLSGLEVRVVGRTFELPVALAADRTFTLMRDAKALAENARVRTERHAGSLTWRAEVRTPGLPADVRRLGDLRLECEVGMRSGLVSDYSRSFIGRFFEALHDPARFCSDRYVPYLFFADRPLFSVTLRDGERRRTLSVARLYAGMMLGRSPREDLSRCDCELLLDRSYMAPLGDRSWPDDALVELDYMDAPPDADDPLRGWSKGEVAAVFGEPATLRFAGGAEVWAYQFGPADPDARAELVVLFDASGAVARSRRR